MRPTTSASAESAARPPCLSCRLAAASFALVWMLLSALNAPGQPMPRDGGAAPGRNPAAPADAPANPAREAGQFPEGFQPPKAPPPEFSIEKELITAEELAQLEKKVGQKHRTPFRRADMSVANLVPDWAKLRIYPLTLKENRNKLHDLRNNLMAELNGAGNLEKRDQQAVRRFREMLMKEVQARAVELLDGNFYVRMQAVLILSNLTLVMEGDNVREEAYTPAWEPLHQVIADEAQHKALKILACRGLQRILLLGTLRSDQAKTQIARTLLAELQKPQSPTETDSGFRWYQMRLCETLGAIDLELSLDNRREPLIIDGLSRVAADEKRDLCVRAEAAKALGRAPLPTGTSEQVLAWVIADVAYDLTVAYNKDAVAVQRARPNGGQAARLAQSQLCLYKTYLAYQPEDRERRLYAGRRPGLLAKRTGDRTIADTYGLTVPVVAHAIQQPEGRPPQVVWNPVPDQQVKALSDWLVKNMPATARLHEGLEPLSLNAPGAAAAAGNGDPGATQPTSTSAR